MKTLDKQVLSAATGTLELFGLYLGDRLGLYEALADAGPVTVAELAERAGIHDRYAREWLEQQAVSGVLAVDEPALPYDERRYRLPPEHAGVVADPTHGHHLLPLGRMVVGSRRRSTRWSRPTGRAPASPTPATAATSAPARGRSTARRS